MSQALHTSSTGINAGQSQINVIANNVANINTTAFKSANMVFETLYSRNLSYGSAATKDGGGTNPKQIGLGVKVGGITRNFVSGEFIATGRDMDTMISGNGFYVVKDAEGKQYYTRDGVFSLDSAGNLVTQSGMKVVAANTIYSNASSDKTVSIPKHLKVVVSGDSSIATKKISELNNASITTGKVIAQVTTGTDVNGSPIVKEVELNVPAGDPTVGDIISSFNADLERQGVDAAVAKFSAANGQLSFSGTIKFPNSEKTESNIIAQTGLANSNPSDVIAKTATLTDVINYNDQGVISLQSTAIDDKGIIVATYKDGSVLTQCVDNTEAIQWRYTTPDGIVITGDEVAAGGSLAQYDFVIELATMVNQEGLISINNNLWEWGPDVGEIFYGMAGEKAFGLIESGGYEGSNVDIAFELTNMISAQRMIQMNSRVFSTASSVMEILSYLGS